jgi:hypothetical protein
MIAYANQEIKKKTFAKNQLLDIMHIEFKRRMRHGHTLYYPLILLLFELVHKGFECYSP